MVELMNETMAAQTPVNDELGAMRKLVNTLDGLDLVTRDRVLGWLADRYAPRAEPRVAGEQ
jgi:hypothetical protein